MPTRWRQSQIPEFSRKLPTNPASCCTSNLTPRQWQTRAGKRRRRRWEESGQSGAGLGADGGPCPIDRSDWAQNLKDSSFGQRRSHDRVAAARRVQGKFLVPSVACESSTPAVAVGRGKNEGVWNAISQDAFHPIIECVGLLSPNRILCLFSPLIPVRGRSASHV